MTTKGGFTALMGAAGGGDPAILDLLLRRGADPRAKNKAGWTALHAAAYSGNPEITRMLIEHGADADPKNSYEGRTPLIWSAASAKPEVIRLLVERGASVDARETLAGSTPLICAAANQDGDPEAVRFLLQHGANASVKDRAGATALDWAERAGNVEVSALLRRRHAVSKATTPPVPGPLAQNNRTQKEAASLALDLLQQSGPLFLANATERCVSCHHQALPAMAIEVARHRGVRFDESLARQERDEIHGTFESRRELLLQGLGVPDRIDPAYLLLALAAHKQPRDQTTDALAHYLTLVQLKDGHWRTKFHRPPMDDGDITATALSLRSLGDYGPPGRASELEQRIARGRAWLERAKPKNTEDRAFQLLGLAWASAARRRFRNRRSGC